MFANRLNKLRSLRKMTQKEVAEKLGIARTTYSGYENGSREPDHETLQKMAAFFEVSVDYLLGRDSSEKDAVDKFIEYLDLELTDEEIMDRLNVKVDQIALTPLEVRQFIAFVRAQRTMTKQQHSASKHTDQ